jgi:hypothetical protein
MIVVSWDTETSGDCLVQLGAVARRYDDFNQHASTTTEQQQQHQRSEPEDLTFCEYIALPPGQRLSPITLRVTKITEAKMRGADSFSAVIARFLAWLRKLRDSAAAAADSALVMMGYNSDSFDMRMLFRDAQRRFPESVASSPATVEAVARDASDFKRHCRMWLSEQAGVTHTFDLLVYFSRTLACSRVNGRPLPLTQKTQKPSYSLGGVYGTAFPERPEFPAHDALGDSMATLHLFDLVWHNDGAAEMTASVKKSRLFHEFHAIPRVAVRPVVHQFDYAPAVRDDEPMDEALPQTQVPSVEAASVVAVEATAAIAAATVVAAVPEATSAAVAAVAANVNVLSAVADVVNESSWPEEPAIQPMEEESTTTTTTMMTEAAAAVCNETTAFSPQQSEYMLETTEQVRHEAGDQYESVRIRLRQWIRQNGWTTHSQVMSQLQQGGMMDRLVYMLSGGISGLLSESPSPF